MMEIKLKIGSLIVIPSADNIVHFSVEKNIEAEKTKISIRIVRKDSLADIFEEEIYDLYCKHP